MQNQTKPKCTSFLRKHESKKSHLPFSLSSFSFFLLFTFLSSLLSASTIIVAADSTGNYTQINEAIQASADGDTIKIMPGIYDGNILIENRNNLTIASLYHWTEQDSFRYNTIIDGNDENYGFRLFFSNNIKFEGLSVRNCVPPSSYYPGGGFYIWVSQNVKIKSCNIYKNQAGGGAGIYIDSSYTNNHSNVIVEKCIITKNYSQIGAGICCVRYSNITLPSNSYNNIYYNYSQIGADIFFDNNFDNIIYVDTMTVSQTDSNFDPYYFHDKNNQTQLFTNGHKIELLDRDVYIDAENGNNSNDGSIDEPFKTITHGLYMLKDTPNYNSVFIKEGIYHEKCSLPIKNNTKLIGENNNVILDYQNKFFTSIVQSNLGIRFLKNLQFKNLLFKNINLTHSNIIMLQKVDDVKFENVIFDSINVHTAICKISLKENESSKVEMDNVVMKNRVTGSYIWCGDQNLNIKNSIFKDGNHIPLDEGNSSETINFMGDYYSEIPSNLNIINSQITNNEAASNWPGDPGAVTAISTGVNSNVNIVNCTISGNEGTYSYENPAGETGKAIMFSKEDSHVNVINSIVYGNDEYDIGLNQGDYYPNENYSLNVVNSIVGNHQMDLTDSRINFENVWNIDPEFCGADSLYPFALTQNSMAIDNGTTDVSQYLGEDFEFPETDLAGNPRISGNTIDLGAYEYQHPVATEENQIQEVKPIELSCYPNPFNLSSNGRSANVIIAFSIQSAGNVELDIYNIKGQKVKSLIKAFAEAGQYSVNWNGKDENGKKVSSGQYFTKLVIGNDVVAKKILVIK